MRFRVRLGDSRSPVPGCIYSKGCSSGLCVSSACVVREVVLPAARSGESLPAIERSIRAVYPGIGVVTRTSVSCGFEKRT